MVDIQRLITLGQSGLSKAQSDLTTAQSEYQAKTAEYETLVNSGAPDAQITAALNLQEAARIKQLLAQSEVNRYNTQVGNLQSSYNVGLNRGNSQSSVEYHAANSYLEKLDVERQKAITNVQDAIRTGSTETELMYLRVRAAKAEEEYQQAAAQVTNSQNDLTNNAAVSVNRGSTEDIDIASAPNLEDAIIGGDITEIDENTIVVTGQRLPRDERVRLTFTSGLRNALFGSGDPEEDTNEIMAPLLDTMGVMFPYTPAISFEHGVNYQQFSPTHANTDYYFYQNTPAVKFNITGKFTAQNAEEARYMLAAMHFFRTVTKMRFGKETKNRGFGPPICNLHGYGDYMFNRLPVLILSFSMELPETVNYVEVDVDGMVTNLPSLATFTIQCVVQQTPADHRDRFSWDRFANGDLLDEGGWI